MAHQVFEPIPAPRRHHHVRVQAEALQPGTPRSGHLDARGRAQPPERLPRPRPLRRGIVPRRRDDEEGPQGFGRRCIWTWRYIPATFIANMSL
jgi:hypothetical protein